MVQGPEKRIINGKGCKKRKVQGESEREREPRRHELKGGEDRGTNRNEIKIQFEGKVQRARSRTEKGRRPIKERESRGTWPKS